MREIIVLSILFRINLAVVDKLEFVLMSMNRNNFLKENGRIVESYDCSDRNLQSLFFCLGNVCQEVYIIHVNTV